jgi:hypothetical protein
LVLAASALSQVHAQSAESKLTGFWLAEGPNGWKAGHEFHRGKLKGAIVGRMDAFTIGFKVEMKGADVLVKLDLEEDDVWFKGRDCMTVRFVLAEQAKYRLHKCSEPAGGPEYTMNRREK